MHQRRCLALLPKSLCVGRLDGGESGIRTHGTFQYTRFPSVRLKPLGHLSGSFLWLTRAGCARCQEVAEREGFEPSMGFTPYSLSRGAPSATRPPLRTGQDTVICQPGGEAREGGLPGDGMPSGAQSVQASRADLGRHLRSVLGRSGGTRIHARNCPRRLTHVAGNGGEGGIRTLEGLAPLAVFKTAAFNRSATSPGRPV